jgi:hypothetical protein
MVDPALGVLEYAMKRKHKDLKGALTAVAKEVLDRAKPVGEGEGLEARTSVTYRYVDDKPEKPGVILQVYYDSTSTDRQR